MTEYFPEPKHLGGRVKVKLYLSNYATKTVTGFDTSSFVKKLINFMLINYILIHLTQVFLLVKIALILMEHNFT